MSLDALKAFCERHGCGLSAEQAARLARFQADLYEQNQRVNLTRIPESECETRHFIDSLLFVDRIETGAKVLDLGTGAGLPAWPLAYARPDLQVTALDGGGKGLAFLARHPLPNLEIVKSRAEDWDRREQYDVVTGRALAPLAAQLELSASLARVGGSVIPFRTPSDLPLIREIGADELGLELEDILELPLPMTNVVRVFPIFRKTGGTPSKYPRKWAQIKTNPI